MPRSGFGSQDERERDVIKSLSSRHRTLPFSVRIQGAGREGAPLDRRAAAVEALLALRGKARPVSDDDIKRAREACRP